MSLEFEDSRWFCRMYSVVILNAKVERKREKFWRADCRFLVYLQARRWRHPSEVAHLALFELQDHPQADSTMFT